MLGRYGNNDDRQVDTEKRKAPAMDRKWKCKAGTIIPSNTF